MSGKGKPINPQRNLNPPLPRGGLAAGRIAQWNGSTWEPVNLAQAVQALIDSGDITITGGSGSVTSVGMILPKEFVSPVSGSPVTGSGTLEGVWLDEAANKVFAGPTTGAPGQPGFRSLVAADMPAGIAANSVTVTVDFGASFSHFAEVVVTGLAWVAADSEIVATPLAATGADVETALLQFSASVGSLVVGTGFTLSVYSPIEAKGTYTFSCVGV